MVALGHTKRHGRGVRGGQSRRSIPDSGGGIYHLFISLGRCGLWEAIFYNKTSAWQANGTGKWDWHAFSRWISLWISKAEE